MSGAQLEIRVVTARGALAEAVLAASGAQAITVLDAGDEPTIETYPNAQPDFAMAHVVGLFAGDADHEPIIAALRAALGDDVSISATALAERDWRDAWRAYQQPRCFAGRLWVAPTSAAIATGDAAVVRLDPGLAFGTGAHPTTALCLAWLAAANLAGRRVLDYGCGSGILAIAAAKLGAAEIVAVDSDEQALRATRDNAAINGVAHRITAPATDAIAPPAFGLVLANVLAQPLIALAPCLIDHLAPGGQLVLSGLLTRHIDDTQAAYDHAVIFEPPQVENDWVCLVGRRRDPA